MMSGVMKYKLKKELKAEAKQTRIKVFEKKLKCFYTNLEMTSNNNI